MRSRALPETGDEALMLAYAHGDARAFDNLYARHRGAVFRYFTGQLTEGDARDCFQTLWLNIIRHRSRYAAGTPFRQYLFTGAHNVLMDHQHRSVRHATADDADSSPGPDRSTPAAAHGERDEILARLHGAVRALPANQREVWLLRQETGFSIAEIAEVTGATEEGVNSSLGHAHAALRQGASQDRPDAPTETSWSPPDSPLPADEPDWTEALYRSSAAELPPPALDEAIRAAARAHEPPWYANPVRLAALATAASLVVAAMIAYHLPEPADSTSAAEPPAEPATAAHGAVLDALIEACGEPPGAEADRELRSDERGWYLVVTTDAATLYLRCLDGAWQPMPEPGSEQQ